MERVVIPSIIAKSQKELDERISKIDSNIYQLDFMDGKFVRNKSLMFEFKVEIDYEGEDNNCRWRSFKSRLYAQQRRIFCRLPTLLLRTQPRHLRTRLRVLR